MRKLGRLSFTHWLEFYANILHLDGMCITYFLPIVILNSIFKTLVSNPDLWKQSVHKELVHNMPFHVGIVSCDSSKVILCWDWIMYLSQKASPNVRFSENISRIGVCIYKCAMVD